jgi:hypothetical protein
MMQAEAERTSQGARTDIANLARLTQQERAQHQQTPPLRHMGGTVDLSGSGTTQGSAWDTCAHTARAPCALSIPESIPMARRALTRAAVRCIVMVSFYRLLL